MKLIYELKEGHFLLEPGEGRLTKNGDLYYSYIDPLIYFLWKSERNHWYFLLCNHFDEFMTHPDRMTVEEEYIKGQIAEIKEFEDHYYNPKTQCSYYKCKVNPVYYVIANNEFLSQDNKIYYCDVHANKKDEGIKSIRYETKS